MRTERTRLAVVGLIALSACSGDWDSDAVATRRYLSRENHRKDEIRRVDAPIIVPALGHDDRLVLRAEHLIHVFQERFPARASRRALRHRVRRRIEPAEWQHVHLAQE